ncbi:MAG: MMPL family transporter, partial [Gammaproteobacteria bacterium]|nr:MMPL family transporter [Gammaproteobacteria bacterium]
VINIEAGDAVISAFKQALSYAVIAISVILLLLLPNKLDSALAMSALLFAVIVTGGISVFLDIPLNFANIIALPLLLGIGVDSAIHILHRHRTALPEDNNVLATSSARAVIVSTFTTMGSIGNLAFSPHAGTASMGKLLTIGIGMTLVATLVILPGLLSGNSWGQSKN